MFPAKGLWGESVQIANGSSLFSPASEISPGITICAATAKELSRTYFSGKTENSQLMVRTTHFFFTGKLTCNIENNELDSHFLIFPQKCSLMFSSFDICDRLWRQNWKSRRNPWLERIPLVVFSEQGMSVIIWGTYAAIETAFEIKKKTTSSWLVFFTRSGQ